MSGGCCWLLCMVVFALLRASEGSASAARVAAAGWDRGDLRPVVQPVSVGGVVVFYAADQGRLRLLAVNPASGATVWSRAASTSLNAQGEPPVLAVAGTTVVYLARAGDDPEARLEALEPATGRRVWRSEIAAFVGWPSICPGAQTRVCVTTFDGFRSLYRSYAVTTGGVVASVSLPGDGPREVGNGLFDSGTRDPETLLAVDEAKRAVAWRVDLQKLFPLDGASTDWGWTFDRFEQTGLYVGSPGWAPIQQTAQAVTLDLSRSMVAGFRIRDGEIAWRDRGSGYACAYLPCPSSERPGLSRPSSSPPTVALRLRSRGRLVIDADEVTKAPTLSTDAAVTIEGFDPTTGRTLWSFDAGRNAGLLTLRRLPAQLGTTRIALRTSGRVVSLDLRTGKRRTIKPSAHGWCRQFILYKLAETSGTPGGPLVDYVGQAALEPCDTAGRARPRLRRVPAFLGGLAARVDDLVIWADRRGLHGAPAQ